VENHPAPAGGLGLETDKPSKTATKAMFDGLMGKLIADSESLTLGTPASTHIDSWENCPAPWLKNGSNEIIVFESNGVAEPVLAGLDQPILDKVTAP
jgi:hypothetical protein